MSRLSLSFAVQAEASRSLGSEIYAGLLERAASDLQNGGRLSELFSNWHGDPVRSAVALRLMGGVHALVLDGRAPALARFYPSAGGRFDLEPAWAAFLDTVQSNQPFLRRKLDQQVQTNEVRRSAVLLGGFAHIANRARLPLQLFEIGSSAGLNLHWDQFRYRIGTARWGNPDSKLELETEWRGNRPELPDEIRVLGKSGCDRAPINVGLADESLRLRSFVWPDQLSRLERLDRAIEIMQASPVRITCSGAFDWLRRCLDVDRPGQARVIFHSVVWWYIPDDERARIGFLLEQHGSRATAGSPLAWLRMELGTPEYAELALNYWPGGEETVLARAHWHGEWVHWF